MKALSPLLLYLFLSCALLASCNWDAEKNGRANNGKKETPKLTNDKNTGAPIPTGSFTANLPAGFEQPTDDVGRKLLAEYGSMFVVKGGAMAPKTVVFKNEGEVSGFQAAIQRSADNIGGYTVELQAPAMVALKEALGEASQKNVTITPRGSDAARRSYSDTVELWASRVNPGLKHWVSEGRLSEGDAARIGAISPYEQVSEIFKLEKQGMYFAKDLSKSIIYSVAPPGTSQHLSMLALDVSENENADVRAILARHGWYQTVVSDLPHFTYIGVAESELGALGLKKVASGGRKFWVPDI